MTKSISKLRCCCLAAAMCVLSVPAADAQQAAPPAEKTPSIYDRIWKFAEWYSDDTNPVVQRVLFSGRFQFEYATLDADEGEHSEWNIRRMRLGPRITLFRKMTFHAEAEVNPQEREPLFVRMTDLYVQWAHSSRLNFTVGKQGVPFTMDGSTSSKDLITIDRSNLANNIWFPQEYMPGVSVSGRVAPWTYRAGLYSSGAANRGLGEFDGGVFTLALLGYDFADKLGVSEAVLTGNYVFQQADPRNTFTRQLDHIMSINFRFDADAWGARTDLSLASGYLGQSDLWAIMLMPFYNLTDKLQLVGRYTMLDSDDMNGVRLATYESAILPGRGDHYSEVYGGANYYFYDHKLKLQTGVQFANMDDVADDGGAYSGTSWVTGVRVGW